MVCDIAPSPLGASSVITSSFQLGAWFVEIFATVKLWLMVHLEACTTRVIVTVLDVKCITGMVQRIAFVAVASLDLGARERAGNYCNLIGIHA